MRRVAPVMLLLIAWVVVVSAQPAIEVLPSQLDFGTTVVGSMTYRTLIVLNTGDEDLTVSASIVGDAFALVGETDWTVPPDGGGNGGLRDSLAFYIVSFEPTALEEFSGTLSIESNDPANPLIDVPLSGEGVESDFPPPDSFGLLEPADGSMITELPTTFLWESYPDNSFLDVTYEITFSPFDSTEIEPVTFDAGTDTFFVLGPDQLTTGIGYTWRVFAHSRGSVIASHDIFSVYFDWGRIQANLFVDDSTTERPSSFQVASVYPNPFNSMVSIELNMSQSSFISAMIYDITGRQVATLHTGAMATGRHLLNWSANTSAGVYLLRVEDEAGHADIRKLVFLK